MRVVPVLLAAFIVTPARAQSSRWQALLAADGARHAVCAAGDRIFAVGERALRSRDGGAFDAGVVLPSDAGYVAGAFAAWCRGARELYAVGVHGQIWRSDGDAWTRVVAPGRETLHDVAGNEHLILAVGEAGSVVAARDGTRFVVEHSGTRAVLTRLLVTADSRAFALSSDGKVYLRDASGRWRARLLAGGDGLVAIRRDARGELRVLAASGRRWRSRDDGATWFSEAALDVGPRGDCGDLAVGGGEMLALCRRATGNLVAMDPPLRALAFVSADDGVTWREEPPPAGLDRLWAASPAGPIYGGGAGVWRRVTSAPPTP